MLRGDENEQGRFGSSLAVLPDINADGLNDLAIGAPLENDGHGSIYIFHGEGMGSIGLTFSQVTDIKINHIIFAALPLRTEVFKVIFVLFFAFTENSWYSKCKAFWHVHQFIVI